jgi:death-on-curing protein
MLFISIQDIMLMHDVLINRFGGSTGLRDRAGLEAALMRPQSGYHPDVIAQAAALFESLIINHPFIDGNKRIAFAAMDTFLRINNKRLNTDSAKAYRQIMHMFKVQELKFDHVDVWLRTICN